MNMGQGEKQSSTSSAPAANRIFGKFRLLANLGSGGSGEVFLALSRSSVGGVNKLVVIKRLKHFAEDDARSQAQEMFLNEARLATLLNHPNIVQTNDVGIEDEHLFLTMEYLEGQPLNAILKSANAQAKKLDIAIGVKIVSEALAGLHYAHELRDYTGTPLSIVHRDLSPHNLFVTYEGMTKVVDFGIAKTAGGAKTEQGVIKGKFAYMAPEQAADDKVDRRADVFVMGIVLWEILTGERLMVRRNEIQTIHRLLNDTLLPPSTSRPEIEPELDAIVMKALEKDPAARYQTAQDMREALEKFLASRSRLVRHEELGALVCTMFSAERTAIRQRIQQYIAGAHDSGVDSLPALSSRGADGSTPNGIRLSLDGTGTHSPLSGTLGPLVGGPDTGQSRITKPVASKRAPFAIAAGVLAVIGVVTYFAFARHASAPDASHAAPVDVSAAAAARAPATPVIDGPGAPVAAAPTTDAPSGVAPSSSAVAQTAVATTPTGASPKGQAPRRYGPAPRPAAPAVVAPPAPTPAPAAVPSSTAARPRVFNTSL